MASSRLRAGAAATGTLAAALAVLAALQAGNASPAAADSCYSGGQVTNSNQVCTQIGFARTQDCSNVLPDQQTGSMGTSATNVVSIYLLNYSSLYLDNWVVSQSQGSAYLASPLPSGVGTTQGGGYSFGQNVQPPSSPVAMLQVAFDPSNLASSSIAFQFNALDITSTDFDGAPLSNAPQSLLYAVDFAVASIAQTPPPPSLPSEILAFAEQLTFAGLDGWSKYAGNAGKPGSTASTITTLWKDLQGIASTIGGGSPNVVTPIYNAQVTAGTASIGSYTYSRTGQQLYTIAETSNGSQLQVYDKVFSLVQLQTCPPSFAFVVQDYDLYLDTYVSHSCTAAGGCPANQ